MKLTRPALRKTIAVTGLISAALFLPACALATPGTASAPKTPAAKAVTSAKAASASTVGSSTQTAAIANCPQSYLTTWIGIPANGTAGSTYYELEISNISSHTCSLYGFPGVSAMAGSHQLGSPADRTGGHPEDVITLGSYATAHVILQITDVGALPNCHITEANGLRVFAPGDYASLRVPLSFQACANRGPIFLHVSTTLANAGIPGYSN
jgi:ABC-type phosphate transport system substrate-binding protein